MRPTRKPAESGLRILHVINDLRVGGAERLLTELVPRLRTAGVDASIAALAPAPPGSFLLQRLREGTEDLPAVPVDVASGNVPLRSPLQIPALARLIAGFDIVHVHLFPAQLWVAAAARLLAPSRRPLLVTTEHNTVNGRRGNRLLRSLDTFAYSRYERIVAISPAAADALSTWLPAAAGRVEVINNGVDVAAVARTPPGDREELFGVADGSPVVACVGRFVEQKDQATLIRALPAVPGLHAAFLGEGPMRPAAETLATELGVAERTHFLGARPDVAAVLRACDLYCQPSRWEGFGLAVVEALAAGLPTLVTEVPGVVDVVGDAGISFPPENHNALGEALRQLLSDPERSAELRVLGPERAQLFDIDHYVAKHLALYAELDARP